MARKGPPRRSKPVRASVPVPQQAPAPPALRPKIYGPGEETSMPAASAQDPAPERKAKASKKADAAAAKSGPTKCVNIPS
eukprot:COSAG02_NODE_4453_length_5342_cov_5.823956_3_plen_80_part_00